MRPLSSLLPRQLQKDVVLSGYSVPKGVCLQSVHDRLKAIIIVFMCQTVPIFENLRLLQIIYIWEKAQYYNYGSPALEPLKLRVAVQS